MGMTIEEENKFMEESKEHFKEWHDMNYIPRADYENRLKADMVAMFTELQGEIEEMDSGCGWEGYRPTAQVIGLIQQKINSLKEAQNDREKDI